MSSYDNSEEFGKLAISEIMQRNVQCAHRGTKADILAGLMIEGFGSILIVDDTRHLLGLVSEYDLLSALEKGRSLGDLTAGELMTRLSLPSRHRRMSPR